MRAVDLRLADMHCHLDFAADPAGFTAAAAASGVAAFANTVTPDGYAGARATLGARANVRLGLGLHPWWVADGTCGADALARFEELAPTTRFVGEVGLDFAPRRAGTFETQAAALERALACCDADGGQRVLSIHAVHAATAVLDLLERRGTLQAGHTCILHWFSGTSDELTRAVRLGCHFSVGTRMLATKRGRAYARAIPRDRLLLETDLPAEPGDGLSPAAWLADLEEAARAMATTRNEDAGELTEALAQNSAQLLDF